VNCGSNEIGKSSAHELTILVNRRINLRCGIFDFGNSGDFGNLKNPPFLSSVFQRFLYSGQMLK
jgi:hypothetical protein